MPELATLRLFALATLMILLVPGPTVLYVVTCSLKRGWRTGLVSVLGVEAGGLFHVVSATLGLSALLVSSDALLSVVKGLGAVYLVSLGVRTLLDTSSGSSGSQPGAAAPPTLGQVFWRGALIDALNPKTALFFLAFLPQFVRPGDGPVAAQTLVLGVVFLGLAALNDGAYALLAGRLGRVLGGDPVFARRWRHAAGGLYLALGVGAAAGLPGGGAAHSLPTVLQAPPLTEVPEPLNAQGESP